MLALLSTAWVVPGLIGPALAGLVADHASWRLVFFGLIPVVAVAAGLALPALASVPSGGATPGDERAPRAAVLLSGGVVLLLYGLQPHPPLSAVAFVVGGAAIATPGFRRLMPAGMLVAAPGLPAAVAAMGLVSMAFLGTETFFPLLVTEVHRQSSTIAGLALSAATLTWTAGAWLQARLAPTHGRSGLVALGALVLVAGLAGLTLPLTDVAPLWTAAVTWGVAGLGMGIAHATISLVVLEQASSGREGAAAASMQLASVLGVAIGAGWGGAAIAIAHAQEWSTRAGLGLGLAVTVTAGLLALASTARLPRRPGCSATS
jgi:MFS family permease